MSRLDSGYLAGEHVGMLIATALEFETVGAGHGASAERVAMANCEIDADANRRSCTSYARYDSNSVGRGDFVSILRSCRHGCGRP